MFFESNSWLIGFPFQFCLHIVRQAIWNSPAQSDSREISPLPFSLFLFLFLLLIYFLSFLDYIWLSMVFLCEAYTIFLYYFFAGTPESYDCQRTTNHICSCFSYSSLSFPYYFTPLAIWFLFLNRSFLMLSLTAFFILLSL